MIAPQPSFALHFAPHSSAEATLVIAIGFPGARAAPPILLYLHTKTKIINTSISPSMNLHFNMNVKDQITINYRANLLEFGRRCWPLVLLFH